MPRIKTHAIIINAKDFSESDRIISMFSLRHGLITAIAKGAKNSMKRFPGTLEPFNEIHAELFLKPGADILRIEEAKLISANLPIREDIKVFAHSSVLLELLYLNLAPMDPHPEAFSILKRTLSYVSAEKNWFPFWAASLTGLLKSIGYGIDIRAPGNNENNFAVDGISGEALMFLERSEGLNPELLTRLQISTRATCEIASYLMFVCNKVSARPLRTVDFLKGLNYWEKT